LPKELRLSSICLKLYGCLPKIASSSPREDLQMKLASFAYFQLFHYYSGGRVLYIAKIQPTQPSLVEMGLGLSFEKEKYHKNSELKCLANVMCANLPPLTQHLCIDIL
jgi:hypothetical protein